MSEPAGMAPPIQADAGLTEVARQVAANLQTLQTLAANFQGALQSSVTDRAALHTAVDAAATEAHTAMTQMSATTTAALSASQVASAAKSAADAAAATATSAGTTAAAASTTATTAKSTADAAKAVADKATADLATLAARRSRSAPAVAVPAMLSLVGTTASVDVDVTWTTPWPDTDYQVVPVLDVPSALLGKVTAAVKTKAPSKTTLTVTTSAVLAASTSTVRAISVST